MSLDEKFIPIQNGFYEIVNSVVKTIAKVFGYPENPGMPKNHGITNEISARSSFLNNLPEHQTFWPPIQRPETWFETIFGPSPKIDGVPRYLYENREEGFYNFYIENYKNIYFLCAKTWIRLMKLNQVAHIQLLQLCLTVQLLVPEM